MPCQFSLELNLNVLQKIKEGPEIFETLCAASLECIKEAKFDGEAQAVFKTDAVQDVLKSAMRTSIKALELISRYYSSNGTSFLFPLNGCGSWNAQAPPKHSRPRRSSTV